MSYKSILKSNIKKVEPKIKKRNVKITCHNKNAGSKVISAITQNSNALCGGYTMKDISTGGNDKDFIVKMELRDGAQSFYDNLMKILNDTSVPVEEPEKSNAQKTNENIMATVGDVVDTVKTTVLGPSSAETPTASTPTSVPQSTVGYQDGSGDDSNKTILLIGGAVFLVLVLILVIWKAKK